MRSGHPQPIPEELRRQRRSFVDAFPDWKRKNVIDFLEYWSKTHPNDLASILLEPDSDKDRNSFLHLAALTDDAEIVKAVAAAIKVRGLNNLNVTTTGGNTAYHVAAAACRHKACRELEVAGIDTTLKNSDGKTAAEVKKTSKTPFTNPAKKREENLQLALRQDSVRVFRKCYDHFPKTPRFICSQLELSADNSAILIFNYCAEDLLKHSKDKEAASKNLVERSDLVMVERFCVKNCGAYISM